MSRLCVLDKETYYDRDYSLSKITTEAYVRDPRFELIGMSYAFGSDKPTWLHKRHAEQFLRDTDWSDTMVVAQNTAFDGAIANWRYGVKPKAWLDIMGMSRALFPHEKSHSLKAQAERMGVGVKGDEVLNALGKRYSHFSADELARYGKYCDNDVALTRELFNRYMGMGFPLQELKIIDMTLRMFIEPKLILDPAALQDHLHGVRSSKLALLERVRDNMLRDYTDPEAVAAVFAEGTDGIKKLLMSNEKFAQALRDLDVEPPMKVSTTTKRLAYAFAKTDEAFQALAEHDNPDVQALVAARLGNKTTIEETRTERFIDMASRGAFPVPLRYYGAHSGRWSGQDAVNMQNLPSRGVNAKKIKRAIMAPPDHVVIDCDSAQIEARVLAWLAGQTDLVQAFERKEDVYKIMASKIYGVPIDQITTQQRQVGKTVVLGAGYGVGHAKLQIFLKTQAGVEVTLDEAKRIIDTYRRAAPSIVALWKSAQTAIERMLAGQESVIDAQGLIRAVPGKGLTLPSGLYIQYPDLRAVIDADGKKEFVYTSKGQAVRLYGGKCVENFTQAVARCVVAEQMLRIQKQYPVVLTVHDSAATIAHKSVANVAQAFVEDCMRWVPKWAPGLPLACESGIGESYGDC
jgi:hypothetical protein